MLNRTMFSTLALVCVLSGCAAGVTRQPGAAAVRLAPAEKVGAVVVTIADDAKPKAASEPLFRIDELERSLKLKLAERGVIDPAAPARVEVTVTDFRVRSGFAAVMFGALAGNDSVEGRVRVQGTAGAAREFTASASYALGGFAGGQDANRLGWLYTEFARVVADELLGGGAP